MTLELPASYLAMPRWWPRATGRNGDDATWLAALPKLLHETCDRWRLTIDGEPWHGSNALVVPVRQAGQPLALRLTPPDATTAREVRALQFWDGRGVVRLIDAEPGTGVSLLERLDGSRTLETVPLSEAMPLIGKLVRELAVPAPPDVPHTRDIVGARMAEMPQDWARLGKPMPRSVLALALAAGEAVAGNDGELAVNGDLHGGQVLAGERAPWLVVDPVLYRGEIGYDLARVLWTRLDEMANDADIRRWAAVLADATEIERERALAIIRFRTVDYWLWGLAYGLTDDPVRCARLMEAIDGTSHWQS